MSWGSDGESAPVSLEAHDVDVEQGVDVESDVEIESGVEMEHDAEIESEVEPDVEPDVELLDRPSVPRPEPTGDPRVDDAIARLDDLDRSPTSEHVAIVDDVQQRLQSALSSLGDDNTART